MFHAQFARNLYLARKSQNTGPFRPRLIGIRPDPPEQFPDGSCRRIANHPHAEKAVFLLDISSPVWYTRTILAGGVSFISEKDFRSFRRHGAHVQGVPRSG